MSTGATVLLVIVLVVVIGAAAWFVVQQAKRRRLRERFGPEYDRRIKETDDRRVAERELTELEKRHARFTLTPLSESARMRFVEQWTVVQEQFVDRPGEAVVEAENLVQAVMGERGYPAEGYEQQAADLSVEHATAVDYYRGGHEIRTRHEQAGVSTEELRQALVHYRKVFVSLVGADVEDERPEPADDRIDNTDRANRVDDAERVDQADRVDPADPRMTDEPRTDVPPTEVPRTDVPQARDGQPIDETPRRTNTTS